MRVVLDLVLFNYSDRPIFAVNVDGIGYEVSGAYPETGKSTTAGFALMLGPKIVTWKLDGPKGTPGNGETVQNKNALALTQSQIVPGAKFISVHIYPDDTVELVTSVHFPRTTARGEKAAAKMDDRHGK
ncbi:hypothetical protein SAMN05428959_1148 [Duganella sp. CF517]|nr:hypothetical protein SAMN05428959_1148 [Duganella sp. CF517]